MIHVGEVKSVRLWVNPQPPKPRPQFPVSLSTATTAFLKIRPPGAGTTSVAVTVVGTDPDPMKHYCLLSILAGYFPTAGATLVQLIVNFANGDNVECDEETWMIGQSL